MFCNTKKQVTIPQEFRFATNERIPPPSAVVDLFDKVDFLNHSESSIHATEMKDDISFSLSLLSAIFELRKLP